MKLEEGHTSTEPDLAVPEAAAGDRARGHIWAAVALVAISIAGAIYSFIIYAPCDDTYIYLVYVRNLLEGDGLTFNGMKVWGFTSVLWTMIIAAFGAITRLDLPFVAEKLGLVAGFLALAATYRIGRKIGMSRPHALVVPALLVTTWDFVFYMSNGLETMFFSAMLVLSLGYVLTDDVDRALRSFTLPAVLSLTILARPEGILVAAIVIAYLAYHSSGPTPVIRCFAWMLAWILPVMIAMRIYYGSWLPNTFYAKAGAGLSNVDQGFAYFMNFVRAEWPVLGVLVLATLLRRRAMGPRALPFIAVIAIWFLDISIRGGDNMVGFRAILPIVPVVYLVIAWAFAGLKLRFASAAVVAIAAFHILLYNLGDVTGSSWHLSIK